ncbi:hypothetical protein ES703_96536 [subsurface metagenome]
MVSIKGRQAHQAMNPALRLQITTGITATNLNNHALYSRLLPGGNV